MVFKWPSHVHVLSKARDERFISAVRPIKSRSRLYERFIVNMCLCKPNIIVFSWTCIELWCLFTNYYCGHDDVVLWCRCCASATIPLYALRPHMYVTSWRKWLEIFARKRNVCWCDEWNDDWLDFSDGGAKASTHTHTHTHTFWTVLAIHFWCQVNLRRPKKGESNQLLLFGWHADAVSGLDYKAVSQR